MEGRGDHTLYVDLSTLSILSVSGLFETLKYPFLTPECLLEQLPRPTC
jgi:hypothetical protein